MKLITSLLHSPTMGCDFSYGSFAQFHALSADTCNLSLKINAVITLA